MAIVAWTWLLYLDEVDTDLMDRFVNEHYGDAPEPGESRPARPIVASGVTGRASSPRRLAQRQSK